MASSATRSTPRDFRRSFGDVTAIGAVLGGTVTNICKTHMVVPLMQGHV